MCEVAMKDMLKNGENLVCGGNAEISLGGFSIDGKSCVIKKAKDERMSLLQLRNEWEVLRFLGETGYEYAPYVHSFSADELVMDFVDGDTLDKAVGPGFGESELLKLFACICRAVEGLHGCNPPVIHRDLKPSNIMLDKNGRLFLIDFGTAKIVRGYEAGDVRGLRGTDEIKGAGTRSFAAPEQYGGLPEECAGTDIYQLGKTMEFLCKRAAVSADFAEDMERIIGKCCISNAAERYLRVSEVRADLLAVRTGKRGGFFRRADITEKSAGRRNLKRRRNAEKPVLFIDIVRTFDTIEFL